MNRRTVLAAAGTTAAALAGCLGGSGGPDDGSTTGGSTEGSTGTTVGDRFDGGVDRPECRRDAETVTVDRDGETREYETAATVPYPDSPESFAESDVVAYVEAFEEAYVTHDVLCDRRGSGHVLDVGYGVDVAETVDRDDDVTTVFLLRAGGATSGLDGDGRQWVADLPLEGVVYAVDETGAARAVFERVHAADRDQYADRAPDPLETGTLVAAFDHSDG